MQYIISPTTYRISHAIKAAHETGRPVYLKPEARYARSTTGSLTCRIDPREDGGIDVHYGSAQNVAHDEQSPGKRIFDWMFGSTVVDAGDEIDTVIYGHMREAVVERITPKRCLISFENPNKGNRVRGWRPLVHAFGEAVISNHFHSWTEQR